MTEAGQGEEGQQQAEAGTYTPPATQADLDRIITDRVNRTKAQYKDFATYKAAADELATIKAANQTEAQRTAEELSRWQADAEKWRTTAVGSRIEALAALDFADPSDAVSALDPAQYLDAGGQINEDAIKAELAAILDRKPHWRRPEGSGTTQTTRAPAPNRAQGSSGGGTATTPAQEFGALLHGALNRT